MTVLEANGTVVKLGLRLKVKNDPYAVASYGLVEDQSPLFGTMRPGSTITVTVAVRSNCYPSYLPDCIPPPPPYLNCPGGDGSPPYTTYRNIPVHGPDPHGFDGDGDHVGCET